MKIPLGGRRCRALPEARLNGEHAWEGEGRREIAGGGCGGSTARARERRGIREVSIYIYIYFRGKLQLTTLMFILNYISSP